MESNGYSIKTGRGARIPVTHSDALCPCGALRAVQRPTYLPALCTAARTSYQPQHTMNLAPRQQQHSLCDNNLASVHIHASLWPDKTWVPGSVCRLLHRGALVRLQRALQARLPARHGHLGHHRGLLRPYGQHDVPVEQPVDAHHLQRPAGALGRQRAVHGRQLLLADRERLPRPRGQRVQVVVRCLQVHRAAAAAATLATAAAACAAPRPLPGIAIVTSHEPRACPPVPIPTLCPGSIPTAARTSTPGPTPIPIPIARSHRCPLYPPGRHERLPF